MLKINLFNQGAGTRKNQQHPGKKSVQLSLDKTENKIKNHNENPANIQVNCLFPNMKSQKNYWCHVG